MADGQVSDRPGPEPPGREMGDVLDQVRNDLDDIDAALRRLEEGSYGQCEACGRPIGEERLTALPAARYCLGHQPDAGTAVAAPPGRGDYEGGFPLDRVP
jgi:RNA polymerase-binding transcription factor DksA